MHKFALIAFIALFSVVATAQTDKKPQKKDRSVLEQTVRKYKGQLEIAKLEHEANRISMALKERKAKAAVEAARLKLEMSKFSLETFMKSERPTKIKEARIRIDQAKNRTELAKAELDELIAMYKADEFAEMTKELVLLRGRRNLEFAKRNLEVQITKLETLEKRTLHKQQKELEAKLRVAESSLEDAAMEQKRSEIELRIMQRKSETKIEELQFSLNEAMLKLEGTTGKE